MFLSDVPAEPGAEDITGHIRHGRGAVVAEDLEEFGSNRDTGCNGDDGDSKSERKLALIQLVVQQVSEHHEPEGIAHDVFQHVPGQRELLKGNPANMVPVCVSHKTAQREQGSDSEDGQ